MEILWKSVSSYLFKISIEILKILCVTGDEIPRKFISNSKEVSMELL